MPRIPVSQHQKTAPGPPSATAVETPMILPVPRVAARVVARAPKAERLADVSRFSGVMEKSRAFPMCRWGKCSFSVKKRWVPISRNKRGQFHRKSLIRDNSFKIGYLKFLFTYF